jgi:hypothetical protein
VPSRQQVALERKGHQAAGKICLGLRIGNEKGVLGADKYLGCE